MRLTALAADAVLPFTVSRSCILHLHLYLCLKPCFVSKAPSLYLCLQVYLWSRSWSWSWSQSIWVTRCRLAATRSRLMAMAGFSTSSWPLFFQLPVLLADAKWGQYFVLSLLRFSARVLYLVGTKYFSRLALGFSKQKLSVKNKNRKIKGAMGAL